MYFDHFCFVLTITIIKIITMAMLDEQMLSVPSVPRAYKS